MFGFQSAGIFEELTQRRIYVLQAKLLRVLQEQEFERPGSTFTHRVDVLVACLRRRSSNRSPRRVSSSLTRHEIRSMGAMASACA
jgi:hypothetical protein